jgi:hypothetical protein
MAMMILKLMFMKINFYLMIQFYVRNNFLKKSFFTKIFLIVALKQKRQNYGINEFVLRAFDFDGNIVGGFDDQQTGSLALRHHICPNGAGVSI